MLEIKPIQGELNGTGLRIAIVASRFNDFVVDVLVDGAIDTLTEHGVAADYIDVVRVPGAFEIPLLAKKMAETGRYHGIVTLGAVIRGETAHFDFVAKACTHGINRAQLDTGVPITYGVLTTENKEQALARAGGDVGHMGCEAAEVLLEIINTLKLVTE